MATAQELAQLIEDQQLARLSAQYPDSVNVWKNQHTVVRPGRVYDKIDYDRSGKLMVEKATGKIYGIKSYGQVHKGHQYGTLETVNDWYWGEFYPRTPVWLEA